MAISNRYILYVAEVPGVPELSVKKRTFAEPIFDVAPDTEALTTSWISTGEYGSDEALVVNCPNKLVTTI